jgi:hypothetical protein
LANWAVPGRRSKPEHKLKPFQHLDDPTQLHRVKVPTQFDSPAFGQDHF